MTDPTSHMTGFIVIVAVLGIGAQWLAWRFRLPAILLLSLAGIAAGPWLGLIKPGKKLGAMPVTFGSYVNHDGFSIWIFLHLYGSLLDSPE